VALALAVWRLRAGGPRDGLTPLQMADSLAAATRVLDTERALDWATRLDRAMPGQSSVVRNVGVAHHNYATYQRMRHVRPRPALRTSLDRLHHERLALALVDSAAALARTDEEWTRAREWRARLFDYLGLPIEALAAYDEPAGRGIAYPPMAERAAKLRARLADPLAADDTAPGGNAPPP
jgi:hypothetical protein